VRYAQYHDHRWHRAPAIWRRHVAARVAEVILRDERGGSSRRFHHPATTSRSRCQRGGSVSWWSECACPRFGPGVIFRGWSAGAETL